MEIENLKQPMSMDELMKMRKPMMNANMEINQHLSRLERLAIWITDHVGTMGFFLIIFFWTVCWLGWNTLAPKELRYDPSPAFVLWLFISNMIQIFLMPLLLIGQNLQSRHAEIRAENDFNVNVKAEREIGTILIHLENQNQLILEILKKMDKK